MISKFKEVDIFCHDCGIKNPTQKHKDKCVMENLTNHHRKFCMHCGTKITNVTLMCDRCYCKAIDHIQWCTCSQEDKK